MKTINTQDSRHYPMLLLPIHPRWAEKIMTGQKTVELRRVAPSKVISRIMIYETAPTSAVIGCVDVEDVLTGSPSSLRRFLRDSCVTAKEWKEYFAGSPTAVAFILRNPVRFDFPRKINGPAPQGFRYV